MRPRVISILGLVLVSQLLNKRSRNHPSDSLILNTVPEVEASLEVPSLPCMRDFAVRFSVQKIPRDSPSKVLILDATIQMNEIISFGINLTNRKMISRLPVVRLSRTFVPKENILK